MNVGDLVTTIVEGTVNGIGTVIGMIHPKFTQLVMKHDPDPFWRDRSPEWHKKPVVVVWFDEPQYVSTLEEWKVEMAARGVSGDEAESRYLKECAKTQFVCFPIDDLKLTEHKGVNSISVRN